MVTVVVVVDCFLAVQVQVQRLIRTAQFNSEYRRIRVSGATILVWLAVLFSVSNLLWFHSDSLTWTVVVSCLLAATWNVYWPIRAWRAGRRATNANRGIGAEGRP